MSHLIIVEIENGTLQGVYTDALAEFEVRVKDADNRQDDEEEYLRLRALIQKGAVRDIYSEPVTLEPISKPPEPDPRACVLIKDQNTAQSEAGKALQNEYAAYIDGYLTASAELGRFLYSLRKSGNAEDVKLALELGNGLSTFRQKQYENYDRLCDHLNTPERFEETEQGAG